MVSLLKPPAIMPYQANDMVYLDYRWTSENRSERKGSEDFPAACGLNRDNGNEMLHFINDCARKLHWTDHLPSYQTLEVDLRTAIPEDLNNQEGIFEWIKRRYMML